MTVSRLGEVLALGQSIWLDFISRSLLRDGDLDRMIREEGLRGMTSNPSIFEKAVGEGSEYDEDIAALARQGLSALDVFDRLAIADVSEACDAFRPTYDAASGHDGLVSIEVRPQIANDTQGSLQEARRLWSQVDRPNVMVKIPGTDAGVPAIRQALSEGININVTLLFSVRQYVQVHEAYMAALEQRLEEGRAIAGIASVASFFVSRIDTLVDAWLEEKARTDGADGGRYLALRGKLGVANSRLVYERFRAMLDTARWRRLAAAGAAPQRLLWASTSTKDPSYPDLLYVENLIGPDTVDTLPEATFAAFKEHGRVARTVDTGYEDAREHLRALAAAGIDVDAATRQLLSDGVDAFCRSHRGVVGLVDQRMKELVS